MDSTSGSLRVTQPIPQATVDDRDEAEEEHLRREQLDQIREDAADAIMPRKAEPTPPDSLEQE
jgi:hypothetical protein